MFRTMVHSLAAILGCALLLGAATGAYGGLISHWKLDETSGAAVDSAGSNDGTVGAAVTQGAAGQIGTAYDFPGSGAGNVSVADDASLKPTSLTISAWVNTTDTGNYVGVVEKYTGFGSGYLLDLSAGIPRFMIRGSGTASITGSAVGDGNWHMLTGTYDSATTTTSLYVDGVFQTSSTASTLVHSTLSLFIGGSAGKTNLLDGSIDDVGLWDEVLSGGRISEIYDFGKGGLDLTTVPEPGTCALLAFGLAGLGLFRRRRRSREGDAFTPTVHSLF